MIIVAEDFLTPTSSGFHPNFTSPTYLATGTREIIRYARGFRYLNFDDVQSKCYPAKLISAWLRETDLVAVVCRLFGLGLATIANSPTLPTIESALI